MMTLENLDKRVEVIFDTINDIMYSLGLYHLYIKFNGEVEDVYCDRYGLVIIGVGKE